MLNQMVYYTYLHITLGPVKPSPILLFSLPDDLYTIQNRNPKLQPNSPAQSGPQALPSLPYLDFQVGQAGQSLFVRLSRAIWLQLWISILYGIEIIWS